MKKIWVLHGPNLNLLGQREPEIYGHTTLAQINSRLKTLARKARLQVRAAQTNSEGKLIDLIQDSGRKADGLILNPGAYTHTSVAIRDALAALSIPVIEVHLSNIYRREAFRRRSLVSPVVWGAIGGFGEMSYVLALEAMAARLKQK